MLMRNLSTIPGPIDIDIKLSPQNLQNSDKNVILYRSPFSVVMFAVHSFAGMALEKSLDIKVRAVCESVKCLF